MTKPITINLDEAQALELERFARESGMSVDEVVREVIGMLGLDRGEGLPPLTEEEQARLDRAKQQVREGRAAPQSEVEATMKKRLGR